MYLFSALTEDDLLYLLNLPTTNLDDLLFNAIILSSFHVLLRLGETTQPDTCSKHTFHKVTLRLSVKLTPNMFSFILPSHKADCFFKSSTILIKARSGLLCHRCPFIAYLTARNACFPMHSQLWLRLSGQVPNYSWIINKMKLLWDSDVGGHSLCSGGATALALAGTPDDHIQAHSHWSSNTYHVYIHKHPIMLQSLLHGRSAFDAMT